MKKAMLMLADGFEEIEAVTPVDLLRRAGVDCQMVSVTGNIVVKSTSGVGLVADRLFVLSEVLEADALILPGGMPGAQTLEEHSGLKEAIMAFYDKKKIIAAICAAPMILGHMGLLKGRHAVIYPGMEQELADAICSLDAVLKDGCFITSRGAGTAIPFALALVEALLDGQTMAKVRDSIVFPAL